MRFQIPNHDDADALKIFSAAALTDMRAAAAAEFADLHPSITAAVEAGTLADEDTITRADALVAFVAAVDVRLDELDAASAKTAAAAAATIGARAVKAVTPVAEVPAAEPVTAAIEGEIVTPVATVTEVGVADLAPAKIPAPSGNGTLNWTITAAADTGFAAGAQLDGFAGLTKAFIERTRSYGKSNSHSQARYSDQPLSHHVASITTTYDEDLTYTPGMGEGAVYKLIEHARDQKRLPGGSLMKSHTAGIGWCAPSETIYSTCSQIEASNLLRLPTIGAPRGGIRHNQGIQFSEIFGAGTGFNILTEAQVIADTIKTCVQIPCPSFVDDRLKVAALCLTGDLLQNVAYPEFVETFMDGALAAQAHNVNRDIIATIVAGSTAVNLVGTAPWDSDGSVVSQVMSAVELAVVDINYRLRRSFESPVEFVFPAWLPAQMRADWIRRNGPMDPDLLDAKIASMFATRNAVVQYVYDWQDAFSGLTTTGPGAATALTALPSSPTVNLSFLAYPAGTWVLARENVIRLESVYDSTLLATNKVTQLFIEEGYLPMRFCPLSRVYTVNICPTGNTGAQRAVDCVLP